jgi:hypothetical protein
MGFLRSAIVIAAMLVAIPAAAQSNGDAVKIETSTGTVEGTLVDKLPDGYLVRVGEETQIVKYTDVKSINPVVTPPPAPPPPPPAEPPPPPPPAPAPVITHPRSQGLVVGGAFAVSVGAVGALVGAVLLPIGLALGSSNQCHDAAGTKTFDCEYGHASDMVPAGAIVFGAGAALMVGGIVMIVVGAKPVPQRMGNAGALTWSF